MKRTMPKPTMVRVSKPTMVQLVQLSIASGDWAGENGPERFQQMVDLIRRHYPKATNSRIHAAMIENGQRLLAQAKQLLKPYGFNEKWMRAVIKQQMQREDRANLKLVKDEEDPPQ
jgi:hypothetical protein